MAKKGCASWLKGLTKETDSRVREMGKNISKAKKIKPIWNKGLTKETDPRVKKIGESVSKNAKMNPNSGTKGKTKEKFPQLAHTEKSKKKISNTMKEKEIGKGKSNGCWRGGTSFEPYSIEFNRQLKELIRHRDNYRCQLCGMPQSENLRKFDIHHIDYDKKDCKPSNLISLCISCHAKVTWSSYQHRKKYQQYFSNKIIEIMDSKRKLIKKRITNVQTK